MTQQHVYGLFFNDEFNEPQCVYIGTTARPVEERFQEHIKGILDLSTSKDLYHYCRQRKLTTSLYVVTLDSRDGISDCAEWEGYWVEQFIKLGHPLQNSKHGNRKLTRKNESAAVFKRINNEASKRVSAMLMEYEKGKGFTVVERFDPTPNALTKPEALRAKVLDAHPTVADLLHAEWTLIDKRHSQLVWGHFVLTMKTTSHGWQLTVFDKQKQLEMAVDMNAKRKGAVLEQVVKEWDNPKSWWKREAAA